VVRSTKKTTAKAKKPTAKKTKPKKVIAKKVVAAKKTVPAKKVRAKKVVVKKSTPQKVAVKAPQGLPEQMRDAVLRILDERQAEEIVSITLTGRSSVADYLIIASGRAARQVTAIADHLRDAFLKLGVKQIRLEGMSEANWVLVDGGDVIVHLFRPEVRRYYDLDSIWSGKPVK
jgi:ribosome-associated protein